MKRSSTIFLQMVIVAVGLMALAIMIRMPMTEGRAVNLSLFEIYSDPFILYGYAASIAFYFSLYQAFLLLGFVGRNSVFSPGAVKALRTIKYCALVLAGSIVLAGAYIRIFHAQDDDPAGFLALCIITTFICIVAATASAVLQRTLQSAVDMKSENDLTV